MNRCTKCGHMTIDTTLYPCKCKVCLICGFVEFYTTLDDLTKFNQNAGIYNEDDLQKIRELLKDTIDEALNNENKKSNN